MPTSAVADIPQAAVVQRVEPAPATPTPTASVAAAPALPREEATEPAEPGRSGAEWVATYAQRVRKLARAVACIRRDRVLAALSSAALGATGKRAVRNIVFGDRAAQQRRSCARSDASGAGESAEKHAASAAAVEPSGQPLPTKVDDKAEQTTLAPVAPPAPMMSVAERMRAWRRAQEELVVIRRRLRDRDRKIARLERSAADIVQAEDSAASGAALRPQHKHPDHARLRRLGKRVDELLDALGSGDFDADAVPAPDLFTHWDASEEGPAGSAPLQPQSAAVAAATRGHHAAAARKAVPQSQSSPAVHLPGRRITSWATEECAAARTAAARERRQRRARSRSASRAGQHTGAGDGIDERPWYATQLHTRYAPPAEKSNPQRAPATPREPGHPLTTVNRATVAGEDEVVQAAVDDVRSFALTAKSGDAATAPQRSEPTANGPQEPSATGSQSRSRTMLLCEQFSHSLPVVAAGLFSGGSGAREGVPGEAAGTAFAGPRVGRRSHGSSAGGKTRDSSMSAGSSDERGTDASDAPATSNRARSTSVAYARMTGRDDAAHPFGRQRTESSERAGGRRSRSISPTSAAAGSGSNLLLDVRSAATAVLPRGAAAAHSFARSDRWADDHTPAASAGMLELEPAKAEAYLRRPPSGGGRRAVGAFERQAGRDSEDEYDDDYRGISGSRRRHRRRGWEAGSGKEGTDTDGSAAERKWDSGSDVDDAAGWASDGSRRGRRGGHSGLVLDTAAAQAYVLQRGTRGLHADMARGPGRQSVDDAVDEDVLPAGYWGKPRLDIAAAAAAAAIALKPRTAATRYAGIHYARNVDSDRFDLAGGAAAAIAAAAGTDGSRVFGGPPPAEALAAVAVREAAVNELRVRTVVAAERFPPATAQGAAAGKQKDPADTVSAAAAAVSAPLMAVNSGGGNQPLRSIDGNSEPTGATADAASADKSSAGRFGGSTRFGTGGSKPQAPITQAEVERAFYDLGL